MKISVNNFPEEVKKNPELYKKHVKSSETDRLKNHIFIRTNSIVRKVVAFSLDLIINKKFPNVVLTSISQNMDKTIYIAELIKQKLKGISQQSSLKSLDYEETYIPTKNEEKLEKIVVKRSVPLLEIILDYKNTIDTDHYGYQPPLQAEKISKEDPKQYILNVLKEFKNKKNVYGWKNTDSAYRPRKKNRRKWRQPERFNENKNQKVEKWGDNEVNNEKSNNRNNNNKNNRWNDNYNNNNNKNNNKNSTKGNYKKKSKATWN